MAVGQNLGTPVNTQLKPFKIDYLGRGNQPHTRSLRSLEQEANCSPNGAITYAPKRLSDVMKSMADHHQGPVLHPTKHNFLRSKPWSAPVLRSSLHGYENFKDKKS